MSDADSAVETALHHGERAEEAASGGDWDRALDHLERHMEAIDRLRSSGDASENGSGDRSLPWSDQQLQSLSDQQERLRTLLEKRQRKIEEELSQIDQIEKAQNTYSAKQGPTGQVLPDELSG